MIVSMGLLGKILGENRSSDVLSSDSSIYRNLFDRIEYSIKSNDPKIGEEALLSKTKTLYLEICKYINCECLDKIYAPVNDAMSRLYSSKTPLSSLK
jgi:hypothetical protein